MSPLGPQNNVLLPLVLWRSTQLVAKPCMVLNGNWDTSLHFNLTDPLPTIDVGRSNAQNRILRMMDSRNVIIGMVRSTTKQTNTLSHLFVLWEGLSRWR